jgi:hypothetical protein
LEVGSTQRGACVEQGEAYADKLPLELVDLTALCQLSTYGTWLRTVTRPVQHLVSMTVIPPGPITMWSMSPQPRNLWLWRTTQ